MSNIEVGVLVVVGLIVLGWLNNKSDERSARSRLRRAAKKAERQGAKAAASTPAEPRGRSRRGLFGGQTRGMRERIAALEAELAAERQASLAEAAQHGEAIATLQRQLEAAHEAAKHWHQAYRRKAEERAAVTPPAAAQREASSDADRRFRALRALIVKELHPDHAPGSGTDRAIRTEVFKALWPKVEAIGGGDTRARSASREPPPGPNHAP